MRKKGVFGEQIAARYLERKGYKVLSKNFHSRFGEIDIVALENKTLVFVEVKLRTSSLFGTPLESITSKKLEKMKKTAMYYLTLKKIINNDFRFDAVEVNSKDGVVEINHVENITL